MVVFACNSCGESFKKTQVEKHLSWSKCKGGSVSCMDCHRDFDLASSKHHTKCITEAEKYSGGNYNPKSSVANGEKKRGEWMDLVRRVAERKDSNRSHQLQQLFDFIATIENIPTKSKTFKNFVMNAQPRLSNLTEDAWTLLENEKLAEAPKPETPVKAPAKVAPTENGTSNKSKDEPSPKKSKKDKKNVEETTEEETSPKKKKHSIKVEEEEIVEISPCKKSKKKQKSLDNSDVATEVEAAPASEKKKKRKSVAADAIVEDDVKVLAKVTTVNLTRKELKKQKKLDKFQAECAEIDSKAGEVEEEEEKPKKKKSKKSKENGTAAQESEPGTKTDKKRKRGAVENGNHAEQHVNGEAADDVPVESNKKAKKRKRTEEAEAAAEINVNIVGKKLKLNDTLEVADPEGAGAGKFAWRAVILQVLQGSKGHQLALKKLRRKVLSEYVAHGGDPTDKGTEAKLTKILNKIPNVVIKKDYVELVQ